MANAALQLLLLLSFLIRNNAQSVLYEKQPRLRTRSGHLLVVSAKNRNITLQTVGTDSFVNINGENLVDLVGKAKQAVQQVNDMQDKYLSSMQTSLSGLTNDINGEGGLMQRAVTLEAGIFNATRNYTRLRNGVNSRLTSVNTRLRKLEKNMNLMRRNLNNNECDSNPCKNGGVCEDAFKNFYCRCANGWEGPTCEDDINECGRFIGTDLGCQNGATCQNKPGSYECFCPSGFFGLHCTQSSNNCSTSSAAELCGHGTCIPQRVAGKSYSCLCDQGWSVHPVTGACTVDVNECDMQTRPACSVNPPVPCINTPGSFQCGVCPQGYTGNGYYCTDVDECLTNNGGCSDNPKALCINTMGSRVCGPCPSGFSGDGLTCTPSRPCDSNNGGCHSMARCYDNPNVGSSYVQCVCPRGYEGAGFGPNGCVPSRRDNDSDVCSPNPCAHGNCYPAPNVFFTCTCYPGYKGILCDTPIMDTCNPNPCQNDGVCVTQSGTTVCRCKAGFTGQQCQFRATICGGTFNQDSGSISFSTHSEQRSEEINCLWYINVNENLVINGQFPDFSISLSPDCNYDWLQIHDGPRANSPSIGTYCKALLPPTTIVSSGNSLVLWYYAPGLAPSSKFTFQWNATTPSCGGILSGQQGVLKSPGFPGKYPPNRNCIWNIRVRQGRRVRLHIFTLQLQSSSNCSDTIEVRDGNMLTSRIIRKICNASSDITPITSSGSHVTVVFRSDSAVSEDHGFDMTFTETAGVSGCGGIFTAERGEITSPNYPRQYSGNLYCEYLIQLPQNERIKIQYSDIKIESSAGCKYDSLEVREGPNENSPLVSKLCGVETPSGFISNGNELLFIFRTDASTANRGFKIKYDTACGGTYTALSGMISSPNYPNKYLNSKTCIYKIALPLHKAIVLQFLDMEIEHQEKCAHDYVEIRDGAQENAMSLGRFCGNSSRLPPITLSSRNFLFLRFKTDSTVTHKGFVANYSSIDTTCGGILTAETGVIVSPNNGDDCTYVIHVPRGLVIRLTWTRIWSSVSNPGGRNCIEDYAQVFDNSSSSNPGQEIGKYCGSTLPPMLTSQGNMMTIVFHQSEGGSQFELAYNTIRSSSLCGGNYFTTYGMIRSPNFPKKYGGDLDCIYTIAVESGQQISLNFTYFDLENSTDCGFDYVEIRNGPSGTSPLVGQFCGIEKPPMIPSHSNSLWIRFHTDNSINGRGFRAIWDGASTGCGGVLRTISGHIESPNYPQPYGVGAECMWKIYVSKGNTISLSILDLELEKSDSSNSCFDFIEFRDGESMNDPLLLKSCDNSDAHKRIMSTGNTMWIMFKTDASDAGRGFSLRYTTVCNNTLKGFRGVIESPNFPEDYPHNSNCSWIINAPPGNQINVSFSHFALEKVDANCSVDYVKLRTASDNALVPELIGTYCSTDEKPEMITSKYNNVYLDFVTDFSVAFGGFRMEWVVHGCGGRFESPYGTLQSPNYPGNYPPNTECRWEIVVDWDKSVELTINDLNIELSQECGFDSLKVYGGPDESSPLLLHTCSTQTAGQKVTSSGRYMTVYFKSDHSLTRKGFYAFYRSIASKCGGRFTANKGGFHSLHYPQNFEANTVCTWLIEVDPNYTVELKFSDFDVPGQFVNNTCISQYVAVWDGPNDQSPLLLKHCGNDIPEIINSTSNAITVRMITVGPEFLSKGFTATYKIKCGATITANSRGELRSVNVDRDDELEPFSITHNCTWIIVAAQPTSHVNLVLTHLDVESSNFILNQSVCDLQYLEVRDGIGLTAPLIGTYCDRRIPPHIVSNGQALTVNLVTIGGKVSTKHFSATYSVDDAACGGSLTSEMGSFASPGYPGSYKLNSECIWQIGASPGNKMQLTFSMFDLEQSDGCNNDYLEIRSGSSGADELFGVYCGDQIPSNITASNKLWIKFRSDGQNVGSGFLAQYSMVHGGNIYGTSGKIASPLYPKPFTTYGTYWWRIFVRPNRGIRIIFKELYLNSISCLSSINIYDGNDENAPLLVELCEKNTNPESVISTNNVVYIELKNNPMWHGMLFLFEWGEATSPRLLPGPTSNCGSGSYNITSNSSVTISSPGFPNGYGSNLRCEWLFEAPPTYHVALYFNTLDVEQHPRCAYDYVALYSASRYARDLTLLNNYCHPNATQSLGDHASDLMKVVFRSDAMTNKTGFSASVIAVCGSNMVGPSGTLDVFNLTMPAPFGIYPSCEWNVTVRTGRTITVDITSLNIFSGAGCSDNYLMLKNGHGLDSPMLGEGRYCGSIPPGAVLETSGNKLFIKYNIKQRSGQGAQSEGFKLNYQETSSNCGGRYTFKDDNGPKSLTIMSPNHPRAPLTNTECEWVFLAPPGKRLRVDFNDRMSFAYSKNCEAAFVEFYDGGSAMAPTLGRFCRDAPSSIITSENALFVKYQTTAKDPKPGFSAEIFVDVCGGTLRSTDMYKIEVPEYSTNRPFTCVWHVISVGSLISYSFEAFDVGTGATNCSSDYVEVKEVFSAGPNSVALRSENHQRYCGTFANRTFIPTGSDQLVITLNSTMGLGRSIHKYFKMSFRTFHQDCGGTLNTPEGEITSPGYPDSQSKRQVCTWLLTVPPGRRVKIEFLDFDLDGSRSTCQQWLGIYNEHSSILPIGLYCGGENPPEISSSSNKLMIQSLTWHTSNHRGFKIKYSSDLPTVCEGNIQQNFGYLTFPSVNMTSVYCQWNRVVPGGTFAINVLNASINANPDSSCFRSSRTLIIGKDFSYSLAQFCGTVTTPKIVTNPFPETLITARSNSLENRISFHLAYRFFECGGLLKGPMDTIQSPPNMSMDCAWSLAYSYGQINLTMAYINFTAGCSEQYINVYNGMTSSWPLIGRFCEGNIPPRYILGQSGQMYIEYHGSNAVPAGSGFLLNTTLIQKGCGGIFHAQSGMITSPNYPNTYKNNSECEWEIVVDEGYHIGLRFIHRFFIETSPKCTKDFLEVFDYVDDQWSSLGKICGRDVPKPFNSTGNRMKVLFRSDNATTADGFVGLWGVNCGGVITATEGYLISPSYPSNYGKFLNCKYVIRAPSKAIMFQFVDFSLEQGFQDCRYDNVTVRKITPVKNRYGAFTYSVQTYCGQDAPPDGVSVNTLTVTFQTDKWIEKRGFRMKFVVDDCGGVINETTIKKNPILSPSLFGISQMTNVNCTWTINAPDNKNILLRFQNVDIKRSNKCILGSVKMFNSSWANPQQQVGKFCGNITDDARNFVSKSSTMTLSYTAFRSFMRVQPFSVSISFTYGESVGCGGHINASATQRSLISSYSGRGISGNYENMLDCRWYVQSSPGDALKLVINNFNVKDCNSSATISTCNCDYLEVRDGSNQFSPLLGRFCGSTRPDTIISSGRWLYIRFFSDDYQSATGFQAQIERMISPCGNQLLTVDDTLRELTSPGFASNLQYGANLRCRWKLRTAEAMRFDIHVTFLDMEDSTGCTNDKLIITEEAEPEDTDDIVHTGQSNSKRIIGFFSPRADAHHESLFCGKASHIDWYSRRNKVDIIFETNDQKSGKGFKLQYQYARCSRNFTRPYGRIHYQGQIKSNVFTGKCTIMISTEANRTVSLYFSELYSYRRSIMRNGSCNGSSTYEIYDGLSLSSPKVASYCGVNVPNPVFSTGPNLMIVIDQNLAWAEEGFDATYTTSDKGRGCGGIVRNVAGSLSSPLFPRNPKTPSDCVWEITVPQASYVKIAFTAFNLGVSAACGTDFLKIYEIETGTGKEIFKTQLCGNDMPAPLTANSNSVLLKYTSNSETTGIGWRLNYGAIDNIGG